MLGFLTLLLMHSRVLQLKWKPARPSAGSLSCCFIQQHIPWFYAVSVFKALCPRGSMVVAVDEMHARWCKGCTSLLYYVCTNCKESGESSQLQTLPGVCYADQVLIPARTVNLLSQWCFCREGDEVTARGVEIPASGRDVGTCCWQPSWGLVVIAVPVFALSCMGLSLQPAVSSIRVAKCTLQNELVLNSLLVSGEVLYSEHQNWVVSLCPSGFFQVQTLDNWNQPERRVAKPGPCAQRRGCLGALFLQEVAMHVPSKLSLAVKYWQFMGSDIWKNAGDLLAYSALKTTSFCCSASEMTKPCSRIRIYATKVFVLTCSEKSSYPQWYWGLQTALLWVNPILQKYFVPIGKIKGQWHWCWIIQS